jgi:hypothetical protein
MFGYIARETEAAVAFFRAPLNGEKEFWVPRKKILAFKEHDLPSVSVQLSNESIRRMATPVTLEIDAAFLTKVGVA